jgi:hypothetical protein
MNFLFAAEKICEITPEFSSLDITQQMFSIISGVVVTAFTIAVAVMVVRWYFYDPRLSDRPQAKTPEPKPGVVALPGKEVKPPATPSLAERLAMDEARREAYVERLAIDELERDGVLFVEPPEKPDPLVLQRPPAHSRLSSRPRIRKLHETVAQFRSQKDN